MFKKNTLCSKRIRSGQVDIYQDGLDMIVLCVFVTIQFIYAFQILFLKGEICHMAFFLDWYIHLYLFNVYLYDYVCVCVYENTVFISFQIK